MKKLYLLFHSIIGVIITVLFHHYFGLGSVLASSLMGLIAGFLFDKYKTISFSASFIGMSTISVLVSPFISIISGIFLFFYWQLLENKLVGVGGKLGTLALISCLSFAILLFVLSPSYSFTLINVESWNELNLVNSFWITLVGILGTISTLLIRNKIVNDSVVASSIVGLISCLLLSPILAFVAYSASFAGMSSRKILKNYKRK